MTDITPAVDWRAWNYERLVDRHERLLDELGVEQLSQQERAAFRPLLQEAYRQQVAHARRINLLTVLVAFSTIVSAAGTVAAVVHR